MVMPFHQIAGDQRQHRDSGRTTWYKHTEHAKCSVGTSGQGAKARSSSDFRDIEAEIVPSHGPHAPQTLCPEANSIANHAKLEP